MSNRDRTVIAIVGVLAALAAAWLLVIQPKRDQAAKLGASVKAAQSQLASSQAELSQREAAQHSFPANYAQLVRLGEAVPSDDNVPSLIYQLQGAASAAHVDFRGLQLSPNSSSAPPASSPSASQASTATLPPGATVGPAGFPIEPFTFTFQGNFFHLADFFHRLQRFVVATNSRVAISGRLITLNSFTLQPATQGFPQISAQISATTYLVPPGQGLLSGATPAGPASSTTQQVAAPRSPSPTPTASVASPLK